jgi:hypothetical protein
LHGDRGRREGTEGSTGRAVRARSRRGLGRARGGDVRVHRGGGGVDMRCGRRLRRGPGGGQVLDAAGAGRRRPWTAGEDAPRRLGTGRDEERMGRGGGGGGGWPTRAPCACPPSPCARPPSPAPCAPCARPPLHARVPRLPASPCARPRRRGTRAWRGVPVRMGKRAHGGGAGPLENTFKGSPPRPPAPPVRTGKPPDRLFTDSVFKEGTVCASHPRRARGLIGRSQRRRC